MQTSCKKCNIVASTHQLSPDVLCELQAAGQLLAECSTWCSDLGSPPQQRTFVASLPLQQTPNVAAQIKSPPDPFHTWVTASPYKMDKSRERVPMRVPRSPDPQGGLARGMNLFRCAHLKRAVAVQQIPVQGTPLRHTRPKVPASGKSEGAPKHSWQRRYTSLPTWVTASPETSPEKGSQCGFLDLRIHRRG